MHRLAQLHQRALERGKVGTILQLLQMAAENIPEAHRIPIETPEDHLHRLLAIADRAGDVLAPQIPHPLIFQEFI